MTKRLTTVVIALLCATLAFAQQTEKPDPRLDQKVTFKADAKMLAEVCEELTKQTGVSITAGIGERDWKSRERRVSLRVNDLPLRRVLNELAESLNFHLSQAGTEPKWEYRLWQDLKGREYEKAMLISQQDQADRDIKAVRQKVLDDAKKVASMTKEEAEKLREKDPWLAYLGSTDAGRAYAALLTSLPPVTQELMLRGRRVNLSYAQMTPTMQGQVDQMVKGSFLTKADPTGMFSQFMAGMIPNKLSLWPVPKQAGASQAGALGMAGMAVVTGKPKQEDGATGRISMGGASSPMDGLPLAMLPLAGSDSAVGKLFGKMILRLEAGDDFQSVQRDAESDFAKVVGEATTKKFDPTPTPTDPRLLKEIEPIKPSARLNPLPDILDAFSKQSGLSFVLEYHDNQLGPVTLGMASGKTPLYQVLDNARVLGLTWTFNDGVVRLRPEDWAVQRSYDVPFATLERYRALLKNQGYLKLDDMAAIVAGHTEGQVHNRFVADKALRSALTPLASAGFANSQYEMFKLYGLLTPAQRTALGSEEGLSFDQLNLDQWDLLAGIIEEEMFASEIRPGRIKMKLEASTVDLPAMVAAGEGPEAGEAKPEPAKPEKPENKAPAFYNAKFTIEMQKQDAEGVDRHETTVMIPGPSTIKQTEQLLDNIDKGNVPGQEKEEETAPASSGS